MGSINIEQSIKQGDALSCALFILCMDPLIRKVNGDNEIEGLNIGIKAKHPHKVDHIVELYFTAHN